MKPADICNTTVIMLVETPVASFPASYDKTPIVGLLKLTQPRFFCDGKMTEVAFFGPFRSCSLTACGLSEQSIHHFPGVFSPSLSFPTLQTSFSVPQLLSSHVAL